jgi:hypothetical protein
MYYLIIKYRQVFAGVQDRQNLLILNTLFNISPINTNLLYLHMVMGVVHTYYKIPLKKWLLAFTFIISFFALSGYVKGYSPNGKSTPETTVLTNKSTALKSGISYKRVALALYKPQPSFLVKTKHFNQNNRTYLNLIASKYAHLKWVYLSIKSNINYLLKQESHFGQEDYTLSGSHIIC